MSTHKIAALFSGLIFLITSGFGQSLGDVARTQRQKQSDRPAVSTHKVITDDDIPAHSDDAKSASATDKKATDGNADAPLNRAANGEELKANCLAAKQEIKEYQAQLDKFRGSIQFVEANRYSNGVQYNQHQLQKQQEADRMQKQLDRAKKRFEDLQEQARKAGFGSSVYDP
jgi:predicted RNase H-like nuclease (RuvC/YqgF family)